MSDTGWDGPAFTQDLTAAFDTIAEAVPTADGRAWLGEVALRELMGQHLDEDTLAETSVSEWLLSIADGEPHVLVHYAVRNPGPPDWDWSLDSFRIGDRGYIALILEEEDDEPFQPVYGAWEPFDSRAAFEACFIAVYQRHLDPILFGTHLWLGQDVSHDLLTRALWPALEAADSFHWERLRDYALPLDTPTSRRTVLDYYVANAREP